MKLSPAKRSATAWRVKPTDKTVVSPAAGTIVKIFNTNHAFCLETEKGAEIVVHMGIDTVALNGQGFKRPGRRGCGSHGGSAGAGTGSGLPECQCAFHDKPGCLQQQR
ncbi:pts system, N-acetylglucosamine-specific IIABC component [Salmonella enterica subsp. enterica]|nr:pts system, N-acetylglucosamine-specific IIABC component [Salmonella enterica subsp. enterica]